MKSFFICLIFSLGLSVNSAAPPVGFFDGSTNAPSGGGGGSNPPASPLVKQNFEGSGYDNGETWTESGFGSKDEDYTASPAPLLGSQSLYTSIPDSTAGRTEFDLGSGGVAECWGFCILNIQSSRNDCRFINMVSPTFTYPLTIGVQGSVFRVSNGSSTADTVATFSTGVTYYIWWHYLKGSGSNGISEIWFSTTTTKPADGSNNHAKTTAGTSTENVRYFDLGGEGGFGADFNTIFDHVYIDDEVILSNP